MMNNTLVFIWFLSIWVSLQLNGCQNREDLRSIRQEIIKLQEVVKSD